MPYYQSSKVFFVCYFVLPLLCLQNDPSIVKKFCEIAISFADRKAHKTSFNDCLSSKISFKDRLIKLNDLQVIYIV